MMNAPTAAITPTTTQTTTMIKVDEEEPDPDDDDDFSDDVSDAVTSGSCMNVYS